MEKARGGRSHRPVESRARSHPPTHRRAWSAPPPSKPAPWYFSLPSTSVKRGPELVAAMSGDDHKMTKVSVHHCTAGSVHWHCALSLAARALPRLQIDMTESNPLIGSHSGPRRAGSGGATRLRCLCLCGLAVAAVAALAALAVGLGVGLGLRGRGPLYESIKIDSLMQHLKVG